ncbi:MAG: MFS transporter [Acidimicrobiia bacterium]
MTRAARHQTGTPGEDLPPHGSAGILLATAVATTVCVSPPFLLGAMAVQIRADLRFSAVGTGLGVGAFFGAASLSSAVLGRLAERFGAARALRLAVVWSGIAQLAAAVAARSLPGLLVVLAVAGGANALAQPAANLLIVQSLPGNRQGMAFAVKQSCVPLSTLLGGLAVPALALTVGWRWAFVGAAAVSVVSALGVPRVSESRRAPSARSSAGQAPMATMAVLSMGISLGAASCGALGAFLVSAGVETGLSPGTAGLALTLGSILCVTGRLLAGARADRRKGGHLRVVAIMLGAGSFGCLLLATAQQPVFLSAIPIAFGLGWAWPGLFNLAVVQANPGSPAAATGITQTGTYFGAVAGPLAFGFVAERWSFSMAWLLAAACSAAATAAICVGRAMLHRELAEPDPLPPLPV